MTQSTVIKPRNWCKVEYRRVQKVVEQKIAEGHPALQIYDELMSTGQLTMSYNNFLYYVRGRGERRSGLKALQKLNPSQMPDGELLSGIDLQTEPLDVGDDDIIMKIIRQYLAEKNLLLNKEIND